MSCCDPSSFLSTPTRRLPHAVQNHRTLDGHAISLRCMLGFKFVCNGHEIIGWVDFVSEGAPGLLFHEAIQVPQGIRRQPQLDDKPEGHGHHPGDQFGAFRWEVAVEACFFELCHDFIQGFGLIVL